MKTIQKLLLAAVAVLFLSACETSNNPYLRETGFKLGAYKAAREAIDHHPSNVEVVEGVVATIDLLLQEQSIVYTSIETWWAEEWPKVSMDPIEKELLEDLVIVPLWRKLKERHKGTVLDITNSQVRADIAAFKSGLQLAL